MMMLEPTTRQMQRRKKIKQVQPDVGDGALVKVKPSKSTIPRLCKLIGVVALVVVGILVGAVVGLKSSSDNSGFIASTGSYSSFSSAGSDTSSGSYWPSSAGSSDTTSGSYEPSTSGSSGTSSHSNWLSASTSSTGSSSSTSSIGSSSFTSSADLSPATLSAAGSPSSGSSSKGASSSPGIVPVSTLVDSGSYLTTDGGIAMTSNGVIYLSDGARILRVTDGSVPILCAGSSGDMNFVDGSLLVARFYSISALAISSSGDLFVCDFYKVRKISGNTVSTLYTAPSSLSFYGIAVDSSGNVYVTDYNNGKITKITSTGVSSTFSTNLSKPWGIVIDSSDNIYVTDNNRVIKFTSNGAMTVLAGSEESGFADGTGTSARFQRPDSMAIGTDGDLYVADRANYCIRKVSLTTSEVYTYVSSGPFEVIWAVAAAPDNVLYVRDRIAYYNQRVLKAYRA